MKPQMHYGEDDCPISVPSGFPKDDELHFEIEMIDFFKAKARILSCNSSFLDMSIFCYVVTWRTIIYALDLISILIL